MGIEITFTSTHHRVQRNDATRIQVRLQSHQRLFRVKGWSPAEGLIEEPLELSHEIPGMRSAILPGSGDYHLSDPLHIHRQSDRYFRIDGEELSLGSRDAVELHYKTSAQVTFGDLRSAVADAQQVTAREGSSLRAVRKSWLGTLKTLEHMEDPRGQQAGADYLADFLDRALQQLPQPKLIGSPRQTKWAKDLRLRAIQKMGLLGREVESPEEFCAVLCAQLLARTESDSGYWIGLRDLIMGGDMRELLEAMLEE